MVVEHDGDVVNGRNLLQGEEGRDVAARCRPLRFVEDGRRQHGSRMVEKVDHQQVVADGRCGDLDRLRSGDVDRRRHVGDQVGDEAPEARVGVAGVAAADVGADVQRAPRAVPVERHRWCARVVIGAGVEIAEGCPPASASGAGRARPQAASRAEDLNPAVAAQGHGRLGGDQAGQGAERAPQPLLVIDVDGAPRASGPGKPPKMGAPPLTIADSPCSSAG